MIRTSPSIKLKKHVSEHMSLPPRIQHLHRVSHAQAREIFAVEQKKFERVVSYLKSNGIEKIDEKKWHRSIHFKVSIGLINKLFKIKLIYYTIHDEKYLGYKGHLYIDRTIAKDVSAVYGLNEKIIRSPKKVPDVSARMYPPPDHSFDLSKSTTWYQLPINKYSGKGQIVGVIEFGGGYDQQTLKTFFQSCKIIPPPINDILTDGAKNNPDDPNYILTYETFMDVEIVAGIASGADQILVYFTQNHRANFVNVLSEAILGGEQDNYKTPNIITSSWGDIEKNFTKEQIEDINQLLLVGTTKGVTCIHASGDHGATGSISTKHSNVFFPASSPWNLSAGGTQINTLNQDHTKIIKQVSWNVVIPKLGRQSSGGGFSKVFKKPAYQISSLSKKINGRGVPDVAANANYINSIKIFVKNNHNKKPIVTTSYGTSAAAPFWAAYLALCNEALVKKGLPTLGNVNAALYYIAKKNKKAFMDITEGNNGIYTASVGWDPCTGLGCMQGRILLKELIQFYSTNRK